MDTKYNILLNDFNKLNENFESLKNSTKLIEKENVKLENQLNDDDDDSFGLTEQILTENKISDQTINNLKKDLKFSETNLNDENFLVNFLLF